MQALETSEAVWNFLLSKGGLSTELYDEGLVHELGRLLEIKTDEGDPTSAIANGLKERAIPVERFVTAFFLTVRPFATMMSDLCAFFERHEVKRTNEAMPLGFDFDQVGGDKLRFDLTSFRRVLETWERVVVTVVVSAWTLDDFWNLYRVFSNAFKEEGDLVDQRLPRATQIFIDEWDQEIWPPRLPPAPTVGEQSVDGVIAQIWSLLERLLNAWRDISEDRVILLDRLRSQSWNPPYRQLGSWNEYTLAMLASDNFVKLLLPYVHRWAEGIRRVPKSERALASAAIVSEVAALFRELPLVTEEQPDFRMVLQDILDLPIWSHRHELYSAWVLTRIDDALQAHVPIVHHHDGVLRFDFKATHLETAPSQDGLLFVMSEVRTRLLSLPAGKGRTANIQPDFRITRAGLPGSNPADGTRPYDLATLAVIEVKQYRRSGRKNFIAALKDYASGCKDARILLVNYGSAAATIQETVEEDYPGRINVIGDFRPYDPSESGYQDKVYRRFKESLLSALPGPLPPSPEPSALFPVKEHMPVKPTGSCAVVYIDVSASMESYLASVDFRTMLATLVANLGPKCIVALNTDVVRSWSVDAFRYQDLLLLTKGGTDLPGAICRAKVDLNASIFLTDDEGAGQLKSAGMVPRGLLVIGQAPAS